MLHVAPEMAVSYLLELDYITSTCILSHYSVVRTPRHAIILGLAHLIRVYIYIYIYDKKQSRKLMDVTYCGLD